MKNITVKDTPNTLTITIDKTKTFGLSKSLKNEIVASTEGNTLRVPMPDGRTLTLGINGYCPPKA